MANGVAGLKKKLQELGFSSYQSFLHGDYWQGVRRQFQDSKYCSKDSEGRICCIACGKTEPPFHIHHKTYLHLGSEHMHLEDLALVCPDCHDEIHNRFESNLWYATEAVISDKKYVQGLLDAIAKYHNDVPTLRKAIKQLDKE